MKKKLKNNSKSEKIVTDKREEGKYQKQIDYNYPTLDSFIKNGGIITDNEYEITSDTDENCSFLEEYKYEKRLK